MAMRELVIVLSILVAIMAMTGNSEEFGGLGNRRKGLMGQAKSKKRGGFMGLGREKSKRRSMGLFGG